MNTNYKVIGLTRLETKLESTAPEANTFTTRPSELLFTVRSQKKQRLLVYYKEPIETKHYIIMTMLKTSNAITYFSPVPEALTSSLVCFSGLFSSDSIVLKIKQ